MVIKAAEIFKAVGINNYTKIKWSEIKKHPIPNASGVYIIEIPSDLKAPTFNIKNWMELSGRIEIEGNKATETDIIQSLNAHWHTSENIIYIGQSSISKEGLKKRLNDFCKHKPGNKGPHTGGFWLKLLDDIDNLNVYYAIHENAGEIEFKMLMYFVMKRSGEKDLLKIDNIGKYLPFANLTAEIDKRHNIKGSVKEKRKS